MNFTSGDNEMAVNPHNPFWRRPLVLLLAAYLFLTLLTVGVWQSKHYYAVTGDEPHYLVMADGLIRHGQLEQTLPYQEEFKTHAICQQGLAAADASPSPHNTHAVQDPRGLFNVHNIGLPILLAIPWLLGGVTGAKLSMILASGLAVVIAWKLSGLFSADTGSRCLAVTATTIALPFLPAAGHIFPDLPAGILSLTGVYWLFSMEKKRSGWMEVALMSGIAFLPWLQIKFAPASALLAAGVLVRHYQQNRDVGHSIRLASIALSSAGLLAAYNAYAFGNLFGPYHLPPYAGKSIEFSTTSLMALTGLFLDQNQGFLLQNPVLFVGIAALWPLLKQYPFIGSVWLLVFLSLIIPNGLHPYWYGGYSFSGRFMWASALVFSVSALWGLNHLARTNRRLFRLMTISGILLQLYFYLSYTFGGEDAALYNRSNLWEVSYPIFYGHIHAYLPSFHDSGNTWKMAINYSWMLVTLGLLLSGVMTKTAAARRVTRRGIAIALGVTLAVILIGERLTPTVSSTAFAVAELPTTTGAIQANRRVATPGINQPGAVTFGPYLPLPAGSYTATVAYQSSLPVGGLAGKADVYYSHPDTVLLETALTGTGGKPASVALAFTVSPQQAGKRYEIRNFWNGNGVLSIETVTLSRTGVD